MSKVTVTFLDDWEYWFTNTIDKERFAHLADIHIETSPLKDEALLQALVHTEVLVLFRERTPITEQILQHCQKLKYIICTGAQNRTLDVEAATQRGIQITYAKGGNSKDSTCELTWALIMAAFKRLPMLSLTPQQRSWRRAQNDIYIPQQLNGKILGLVGLGHIGTRVARIARSFGMNVLCWSPHITQSRADDAGVNLVTKPELLYIADIISIHMVLSESTRHLFDEEDFTRLNPKVCLVNTSRAELINQQALLTFLKNHPEAIYATDVFDQEPLPENSPLFDLDNVLMTGHWGFVCDEVLEGFTQEVSKQLLTYLER